MENLDTLLPLLIFLVKIFGTIISVLLLTIIGLGRYIWQKLDDRLNNIDKTIKDDREKTETALDRCKLDCSTDFREYQKKHDKEHDDIWKTLDECCPRSK